MTPMCTDTGSVLSAGGGLEVRVEGDSLHIRVAHPESIQDRFDLAWRLEMLHDAAPWATEWVVEMGNCQDLPVSLLGVMERMRERLSREECAFTFIGTPEDLPFSCSCERENLNGTGKGDDFNKEGSNTVRMQMDNFEGIVLQQIETLYSVAYQFTGDAEAAERLTRSTLLRALRPDSPVPTTKTVKSWLLTLLRETYMEAREMKSVGPRRPLGRDCLFTQGVM